MATQILSRSKWNAAKPQSSGARWTLSNLLGIGWHYGASSTPSSHSSCPSVIRGYQRYHQSAEWFDIAYNFLICPHGYIYEGRGWSIQSGAHGTTQANRIFLAVCFLGNNSSCTPDAQRAAIWLRSEARRRGVGTTDRPHSFWRSTACPGDAWRAFIRAGFPHPDGGADSNIITYGDYGPLVEEWQELLQKWNSNALPEYGPDKDFGKETREWTLKFYDEVGLKASDPDYPRVGDASREAIRSVINSRVEDATHSIGVYRGNRFHLRSVLRGGSADFDFPYGKDGDFPLIGDWNGDGNDTVGICRDGELHLRNALRGGSGDVVFNYGKSSDIPVVGDWNGDGVDTIGVVRKLDSGSLEWYLKNSLKGGKADIVFKYGRHDEGDIPIVGDWNGDGKSEIGVVRKLDSGSLEWHLRNVLSGGPGDTVFKYGDHEKGDVPIVGDWNGDGKETIGVYRISDGRFHLKNSLSGGKSDIEFRYGGDEEDIPLVGNWT